MTKTIKTNTATVKSINPPTLRTESPGPGYADVDIFCDTIAKGRISSGGYIGPQTVVPCDVGWQTTVIDDSYSNGLRVDIRVSGFDDRLVFIEGRIHGNKFERWNPLPRIERSRPAQECAYCRASVGPGGHSHCETHREMETS